MSILSDHNRPAMPKQTGGVLHYLIQGPRKDPPPPLQRSFLPTIEEQLHAEIRDLAIKKKTHTSRVKCIAKQYGMEMPQAKKLYTKVLARLVHELEYEQYMANQEYYDWHGTPEFHEFARKYIAEVDARAEAAERDFQARLDDGREHVVAIEPRPELARYMDVPTWAECDMHGPMGAGVAVWITEQDARILYANGALKLIEGREDTLFSYRFRTRDEVYMVDQPRQPEEQRYVCSCGQVLDYNTIGFNKKTGVHEYQCLSCLGVPPEYVASVAAHYRSTGCNMFI